MHHPMLHCKHSPCTWKRKVSRAAFHPHFSLWHKVRSSRQQRLHWKMKENRAHSDLLHETFPWNLIRETATGRSEFPSPPHHSAVWAVTGHPIFNTACPLSVRDHCSDTHSESKIYCKKVRHPPVITLTALFSSTHSFIYHPIAIYVALCGFSTQGMTPCSDIGSVCGPRLSTNMIYGNKKKGEEH